MFVFCPISIPDLHSTLTNKNKRKAYLRQVLKALLDIMEEKWCPSGLDADTAYSSQKRLAEYLSLLVRGKMFSQPAPFSLGRLVYDAENSFGFNNNFTPLLCIAYQLGIPDTHWASQDPVAMHHILRWCNPLQVDLVIHLFPNIVLGYSLLMKSFLKLHSDHPLLEAVVERLEKHFKQEEGAGDFRHFIWICQQENPFQMIYEPDG